VSINKQFDRELTRLERVPQQALYKQTMSLVRTSEKKLIQQLTLKNQKIKKQVIARELLWFFAAALIGFVFGVLIFYMVGEIFPPLFIQMTEDLGSITTLFFFISLLCFLGVYIARLIFWAVKLLSGKSE
jgi:hypothetical protein